MWRLYVLMGLVALTSATRVTGDEDTLRLAVRVLDDASQVEAPTCSDEVFVRRAYLEIVGRIPTAEECRAFLTAGGKDRRAALIDELIDSPGHSSRMFTFWADLLRVKTKLNTQVPGAPYINWLKQSIESDKPYDEMVRELLVAEGPALERDNGATGYFLRDRGMPEDNMSNTLRAFLGTRVECAQCHNHPTDQWTQKQFFEMTAFTGGISYRAKLQDLPNKEVFRDLRREMQSGDSASSTPALRRFLRPLMMGVYGSGTGLVRLPDDYQYDDASPKQWVQAEAIFGGSVDVGASMPKGKRAARKIQPIDSRTTFASWLTAPDNPFFTKSIVNRLWHRALGKGLIEPVDELRFDSEPSNPELLERLEELMVNLDYNLDEFLRVIYRTRAWQAERPAGGLQRMSAEQVWDSLLTLVVEDLDDTLDLTGDEKAELIYAEYEKVGASSLDEMRDRIGLVSMRMTDADEFKKQRAEKRKAESAERRALLKENRELVRELARARRKGDKAAEERALAKLNELGIAPRKTRQEREMVRASDLESPAPNGHFLREFGQSDHEQIDGSHTEATVPQALSLLNGALEKYLLQSDDAYLKRELELAFSEKGSIETAFLAVLGRTPSTAERKLWMADFRSDKQQAAQDLIWTLVNSHEFLFIR